MLLGVGICIAWQLQGDARKEQHCLNRTSVAYVVASSSALALREI